MFLQVPVKQELEFPCAASAVYGRFDPLGVNQSGVLPPGGQTHDRYEVGDLSGKYGALEGALSRHAHYNDTNMALFGHTSIMGRSVVIHKNTEDNFRWDATGD